MARDDGQRECLRGVCREEKEQAEESRWKSKQGEVGAEKLYTRGREKENFEQACATGLNGRKRRITGPRKQRGWKR